MTPTRFLATGLAAMLIGAAAQAEQYSIATFLSPTHEITEYLHTRFADRVRELTGGEIDFEVFAGSALLPAQGTIDGVANGVAQAGVYAAAYAPSVFPIQTAIGDLGAEVPRSTVLSFAYTDMILHEREMDEWQDAGVVMIAGVGVPGYHYICTKPGVGTLESLQGLKARTSGSTWARIAEALGVIPVNLPASEIYTSLERGAVDCLSGDVTHLTGGENIGELIKSIAMIDLAVPFTTAGIMFDKDFWQGLTNEQRQLLLTEGLRSMAELQAAYAVKEEENLEWARANGIELNEPDQALQDAYNAWLANLDAEMVENAKNNLGIEDPEPYITQMRSYLTKWEPLIDSVDPTDAEALFALIEEHMLADIDVSKYGME